MTTHTFTRSDLYTILGRVFAEARCVEQGAASPEFLCKLMRATHNIPRVLATTCSDADRL
jgi:hypothetical protein